MTHHHVLTDDLLLPLLCGLLLQVRGCLQGALPSVRATT
jgi:hypothetical protein